MLNKSQTTESSAHMAGMFTGSFLCNVSDSNFLDWIVDSGASDHMVGTTSLLNHGLTVSNPGKVQLATGDSATITQSGNSKLTGGDVIQDVLCVPTFKFNLLSVSKLTKELNCCALFFPDFFILQDLFTGRVKEIGKEKDGLYLLKAQKQQQMAGRKSLIAAKGCEDGDVWHKRLGHVPMNVIRKIGMLRNSNANLILDNCDVCPLARQIRLHFTASNNRSVRCFDLIHLDVWGPYKAATHNNMKFFLTIVDDHSK